jgi:type II secretory pathway component PulM
MTTLRLRERIPVPDTLRRAWDRMSPRERMLTVAATCVVLVAAAWTIVWQPMQDDSLRMRRDLQRERAVLATARAQAAEIAGLQRGTQPSFSGDPRLAIERVLGERGLKGALTLLEVKDTRTTITFTAIGFDALVGLLETLAKSDGLRVVDATLVSRIDPGTVRAEIVLARQQ